MTRRCRRRGSREAVGLKEAVGRLARRRLCPTDRRLLGSLSLTDRTLNRVARFKRSPGRWALHPPTFSGGIEDQQTSCRSTIASPSAAKSGWAWPAKRARDLHRRDSPHRRCCVRRQPSCLAAAPFGGRQVRACSAAIRGGCLTLILAGAGPGRSPHSSRPATAFRTRARGCRRIRDGCGSRSARA